MGPRRRGEIPADLNGVYLRNTENPLHPPIERYHPFDGDGMLHSISFEAGAARYANRFVRTDGLVDELEAQESLWAGVAELPASAKADHQIGARPRMKDAASTDVVVHRGTALASFYMCGDLYRLDPRTLAPDGKEDWNGDFPADGVSAHPKIDEITGEMLFFNYGTEWPYMHYGEVSPKGTSPPTSRSSSPAPGSPTTWRSPSTTPSSTTVRCSGNPRPWPPASMRRDSTATCRPGSA